MYEFDPFYNISTENNNVNTKKQVLGVEIPIWQEAADSNVIIIDS